MSSSQFPWYGWPRTSMKGKQIIPCGKPGTVAGGAPTPPVVSGVTLNRWHHAGYGRWQDVGRTIAASANNDPVRVWDDLSVNASHVTAPNDASRPLVNTGVINGKPSLSFDGVDDYLNTATNTTGGHVFFFGYASSLGLPDYRGVLTTRSEVGVHKYWLVAYLAFPLSHSWTSADGVSFRENGADTNNITGDAHKLWEAYSAGGPLSFEDGTQVGRDRVYASRAWIGYITDIMVYSAEVTGANLTSVRNWFTTKYGVP